MRIEIKTQDELDNLPCCFDNYTAIELYGKGLIVRVAWGNSSVVARGNSSVVARGNSSVEAWENSSVEARENSSVVARGNSSVEAWGNSSIKNRSTKVLIKKLRQESVLINIGIKCNPLQEDKTSTVINKKIAKYNIETFCDIFKLPIRNNEITLYKSVNSEGRDFWSNTIEYKGIVKCPDFDNSPERECGGGLHLSAKPEIRPFFSLWNVVKSVELNFQILLSILTI